MQFNAKTLKLVRHIFRKRILMTFDHVPETFLLQCKLQNKILLGLICAWQCFNFEKQNLKVAFISLLIQ